MKWFDWLILGFIAGGAVVLLMVVTVETRLSAEDPPTLEGVE